MNLKRILHGMVIVPLIAVLTCTQAFGLSFLDFQGLNQFSGGSGGGLKTIYDIKIGLNAAQTNPLIALKGNNATQVATSAVVVRTEAGLLETIAANLPAIEGGNYLGSGQWSATDTGATATPLASGLTRYSGATYSPGGNLGVMCEPAATNLCLQSQEFDATWAILGLTVDDQATTAPNDEVTADKILAGAGVNAAHFVYQVGVAVSGTTQTLSVYAKAGTHNYIHVGAYSSASANYYFAQVFDLSDGSLGESKVGSNGGSFVSASILPHADGWFRCIVTGVFTGGTPIFNIGFASAKTGNNWNLGFAQVLIANTAGTESFYLWQADVVSASAPTSPIPTTTAPVTRAARYTTASGANFGSDLRFDAVVKELGREQWFLGDPTSLAGVYKNSADKVVWRGMSLNSSRVAELSMTSGSGYAGGSATVTFDGSQADYAISSSPALAGLANVPYCVTIVFAGTGKIRLWSGTFVSAGTYTSVYKQPSAVFNIQSDAGANKANGTVTTTVFAKVKELTSTSSMVANTPAIIGVHNGTDGATLTINGTAEATDATMTTPVTWGTTVRVGADTAATAGNVLNGSVSNILSISRGPSNWIKKTTKNNIINLYDKKRSIYSIEDLAA